jgi:Tol biopolymer transport system component
LTNDINDYFDVSTSSGDEAIAGVRFTNLRNLWLADPAGGEARPITRVSSAENSPLGAVTATDGSVVFVAGHDQGVQLWTIGVGGGEAKPITPAGILAVNPRAIPGGVVYDSYATDGGIHVSRVDLDGGHARVLTPSAPAQVADVARDGRFFTYRQLDGDRAMWVMPLDGGPARSLGPQTDGGLFSPDGSRIEVTRLIPGEGGLIHGNVDVVPTSGGASLATLPIPAQAGVMAWSPDGASFTFVDQGDPAWNLARIRMTGGPPERLTHFPDGKCTAFKWSPDGSRLAVARKIGDVSGVWVTMADGGKPVQAARFQGNEVFGMDWSKDGQSIVVDSGRRSSDALLIRNFR